MSKWKISVTVVNLKLVKKIIKKFKGKRIN